MMTPLYIPSVPVAGQDGRRRNVTELYRTISQLVPRGRMVTMEVAHDAGCPCEQDPRRSFDACTCATVDVTLRLVDPRRS